MNTFKVAILLAALTGLFVIVGKAIGGNSGMVIAFGVAVVMNVGAYWFSDKLALASARAQPVAAGQAPELEEMVQTLASRAGLPVPKLYIVNDPSPNAFATGRNPDHAAIAVNTGLLDILQRDEVMGVLAHEMAHIKSRDTLTMCIVATVAGAITMIANFARFAAFFGGMGRDSDGEGQNIFSLLAMMIVAPFAAMLIQLGISRAREYAADQTGAELAGNPHGLANALLKLERGNEAYPTRTDQVHAPLYIVNPLRGRMFASLFTTHPPVEERVKRLRALA